jgi:hypothetical protein
MALALVSSKFYFVETSKATNTVDNIQHMELSLTAANTDVAWDLDDLAGTVWGVIDNTTSGLATLNALKTIKPSVQQILSVSSTFMLDRADVVSASAAGNYARAYTQGAILPSFAFSSAAAPTADVICVAWKLKSGELGVTAEYTA